MPIPSKETVIRGLAEDSLIESCGYFPCHIGLETCNLCFCIFYPCEDITRGEYKISRRGTRVWSCMRCEWAHRKETVERLRRFLMDGKNRGLVSREMYLAFVESLESEEGR